MGTLKNVPPGVSAEAFKNFFQSFGTITDFELKNLVGTVEFEMSRAAKRAANSVRGREINPLGSGPPLLVDWAAKDWRDAQTNLEAAEAGAPEKVASEVKNEAFYGEAEPVEKSQKRSEMGEPEEETTIYVKNLNFNTHDCSLLEHFQTIGAVHSARVAKKTNKKTRSELSMGYGFVTFYKKKHADKALRKLQQSTLDNHQLDIRRSNNSVRKTDDDKAKQLHKNASNSGSNEASTKICVRNVPFQANKEEIRKLFAAFTDDVQQVRMPLKVHSQQHRGYAFVEFSSISEAKKVFGQLSGSTHLYGRRLVLEWSKR